MKQYDWTMKKGCLLLLLLPLLWWGSAVPGVARRLTLTVSTPGSLPELISPADKYKITSLTLRGTLNGTDLRFLREMAGSDYRMQPTEGRLTDIDLSDALFGRGGLPYIVKEGAHYLRGGACTVPAFLFRKTRVERVVLPRRTDTIAVGALELTRLRRVEIPQGAYVDNYAFNGNPELEEVVFPDYVDAICACAFADSPQLRELVMHNVGYVLGYAFARLSGAERIEFRGVLGHIDGWNTFVNCPRLQSVTFQGPVMSTGGPLMFARCPELASVKFCAPVGGMNIGGSEDCPKLGKIRLEELVFMLGAPEYFQGPGADKEPSPDRRSAAVGRLYDAYAYLMARSGGTRPGGFARGILAPLFYEQGCRLAAVQPRRAVDCLETAVAAGFSDYGAWADEEALRPLRADSLFLHLDARMRAERNYLGVLRASRPYAAAGEPFTYAAPTDSGLQRVRDYFNVDSIAGQGDEITRMKRLMYWVHDHVRHDGSSSWPDCHLNAVDLYEVTLREKRGLNCRFMATMLNEMYLAAGFKSRFITCQSKNYQTDPDCHVINMVWCDSLRKWVWMDPTFAAYVTDEHGLLLHPGEVRGRLRKGLPLVLNDDANWNHQARQTAENYLESYMAKNLYVISAHRHSGYQLEGKDARPDNPSVALVPEGFDFKGARETTSDEAYFWQPPQ